jgi:ubiquitin-protein ligase
VAFHISPSDLKVKVKKMNPIGGSHGRLIRDAAELFVTDFTCSASHVQVTQTTECLNDTGSIALEISVFEGPYRGGLFHFCFQIPANYPFRPIEIWAVQPIWHPNIDMKTGRMQIPLDWSPVLTLKSFVIAVQVRTTMSLTLIGREDLYLRGLCS